MNFLCLLPGVSKKQKIRKLLQLTIKRTLCKVATLQNTIEDKMILDSCYYLLCFFNFPHLEISVYDPIHVTVVDRLQDLLDAVAGVGLGVELSGHDVLKQLPARHPVTESQSAIKLRI